MATTTMMTTRERFQRVFDHKEADRVPIADGPWRTTVERWRREGLPEGMSYVEYFDLDHVASISVDNSPRYPVKVLEETDAYIVNTTKWGATNRNWKHAASTPEWIDYTVKSPDDWAKTRARIAPTRDRINWQQLEQNYANWRRNGCWIQAGLWFGFDITHSRMVGTERLLIAMLEQPEWCIDMFKYLLDVDLTLFDMIWDAGYTFDCVVWPDDMGYKGTQFFSLQMYRDILKPVHKRAIDWAHAKGIKTHLHSCGNINPFVPELIEIGLDALNPLEVKAGMDPIRLKKTYGNDLVFKGGINAVLWNKPDKIKAEMERVLPVMKEGGGYIFSSDHSIPDAVSFQDFTDIIALAKKLGEY
ncbi:MAG: hypothetical protein JXR37_34640 [Kiritimatiellae bacterium]|nr:hypothetical protein [Kiritimatiellia bacterium]